MIDVNDVLYWTSEDTLDELARVEIFMTNTRRLQKEYMI